jgi:hypothetical protein
MIARHQIAFLILIIMYLLAGCVSTGDKTLEAQTPMPTDKSTIETEKVNGTIGLDMIGDVKCTVVTQYGGEVVSCAGQILPEGFEEEINRVLPGDVNLISGTWVITYGNLSTFSNLNFRGDAVIKDDGSYKISTYPIEFPPEEGTLEFVGQLGLKDGVIQGKGRSTIYQRGEAFGVIAIDTITGSMEDGKNVLTGEIISVSSFHEGGGAENATFAFVLERE